MLDTLPAPGGGTASPQLAKPTEWGTLSLADLKRYPVVMTDGPTGSSMFWPEWFAVIHPDLATTDVGFNHVDAVWMPHAGIQVRIFVDPSTPSDEPLREAVRAIREVSNLSATDVAAMIGVKRRHFYNLLGGGRASSDRERWIRTLADVVSALYDAADRDPLRVRAAILQPLARDHSLFDLACDQDEDAVREAQEILEAELRAGRLGGRVRRSSPTLRRRNSGGRAASEFLSGYRERND